MAFLARSVGFEPTEGLVSPSLAFQASAISHSANSAYMAGEVGFEPTRHLHDLLVFRTSLLNHWSTPLYTVPFYFLLGRKQRFGISNQVTSSWWLRMVPIHQPPALQAGALPIELPSHKPVS